MNRHDGCRLIKEFLSSAYSLITKMLSINIIAILMTESVGIGESHQCFLLRFYLLVHLLIIADHLKDIFQSGFEDLTVDL